MPILPVCYRTEDSHSNIAGVSELIFQGRFSHSSFKQLILNSARKIQSSGRFKIHGQNWKPFIINFFLAWSLKILALITV